MPVNLTTKKSRDRLAIMLHRLALGTASRNELGMAINCPSTVTSIYLRHLVVTGAAVCISKFKAGVGESTPALYDLAEDVALPDLPPDTPELLVFGKARDVTLRTVTVSTSWAPMPIPQQSPFSALGL